MRKKFGSARVVRAISLGLAAFLSTSTPLTALANDLESETNETNKVFQEQEDQKQDDIIEIETGNPKEIIEYSTNQEEMLSQEDTLLVEEEPLSSEITEGLEEKTEEQTDITEDPDEITEEQTDITEIPEEITEAQTDLSEEQSDNPDITEETQVNEEETTDSQGTEEIDAKIQWENQDMRAGELEEATQEKLNFANEESNKVLVEKNKLSELEQEYENAQLAAKNATQIHEEANALAHSERKKEYALRIKYEPLKKEAEELVIANQKAQAEMDAKANALIEERKLHGENAAHYEYLAWKYEKELVQSDQKVMDDLKVTEEYKTLVSEAEDSQIKAYEARNRHSKLKLVLIPDAKKALEAIPDSDVEKKEEARKYLEQLQKEKEDLGPVAISLEQAAFHKKEAVTKAEENALKVNDELRALAKETRQLARSERSQHWNMKKDCEAALKASEELAAANKKAEDEMNAKVAEIEQPWTEQRTKAISLEQKAYHLGQDKKAAVNAENEALSKVNEAKKRVDEQQEKANAAISEYEEAKKLSDEERRIATLLKEQYEESLLIEPSEEDETGKDEVENESGKEVEGEASKEVEDEAGKESGNNATGTTVQREDTFVPLAVNASFGNSNGSIVERVMLNNGETSLAGSTLNTGNQVAIAEGATASASNVTIEEEATPLASDVTIEEEATPLASTIDKEEAVEVPSDITIEEDATPLAASFEMSGDAKRVKTGGVVAGMAGVVAMVITGLFIGRKKH